MSKAPFAGYDEPIMSINPIAPIGPPLPIDPLDTSLTISRTYGFAAIAAPLVFPVSYPLISSDPAGITRVVPVSREPGIEDDPEHLIDRYA